MFGIKTDFHKSKVHAGDQVHTHTHTHTQWQINKETQREGRRGEKKKLQICITDAVSALLTM